MGCPPRTVTQVFTILSMISGAGMILQSFAAFFMSIGAGYDKQIIGQIIIGILSIGLGYFGYNAITNDRADRVKLYAQIHKILNILFIISMCIAILILLIAASLLESELKKWDMTLTGAVGFFFGLIVIFALCEALNLWHIRSAFATAKLISDKQTTPIYSNHSNLNVVQIS